MSMQSNNASAYYSELVQIIKAYNPSIAEVNKIEVIAILNYEKDKYAEVLSLVRENDIKAVLEKFSSKQKSFEDLTIITFQDQENIERMAIIYDSDDLWQDPTVMDMVIPNQQGK